MLHCVKRPKPQRDFELVRFRLCFMAISRLAFGVGSHSRASSAVLQPVGHHPCLFQSAAAGLASGLAQLGKACRQPKNGSCRSGEKILIADGYNVSRPSRWCWRAFELAIEDTSLRCEVSKAVLTEKSSCQRGVCSNGPPNAL